uniref:Uncharacterized protein n=1 Tax=Panagrolaimus sp. ES5 TaxID=591445 RepID=A0AC34GSR7_9BILA
MLAQEYTNYLIKNLGAKRLFIQSTTPETRNNYGIEYTQSTTVSPIVWLYLAYPGGFILLHLSFIEPYFLLFWNRGQLYEDQTIQDLRSFIKEKNQIISKCHLHSFTYDFHLRMVKTYLVGGTQLLFNRGYNTTAFLIDFLQYYSCRPPSARNCIYEENCPFDALKVPGTSVWENFLDKESKYGWKVVRLKNVEKDSSDEFMLVSEASKKVFDQEYEGVRVITNVLKGNTSKDHKLLIRYYVIMVSKDIENPLLDALYTLHDPIPPGEFKRLPTELYPDLELEDEFPLDFDVAYDSDARQSSGSNSDKSQRHKNRQSMQSIASLASGNNSNDRLSDFDPTPFRGGYVSPCPSPMSQTLVDFSQMTPLASQPGNFDAIELKNKLSTQAAMIQKVPPRGHRKNASISSELRIQGAIPPEQVTYVHYFNNLQKKLQLELEEFARASKVELEKLVQLADRECHVEMDIENPLLDALYTLHDPIPPGEFKRLPTELYPDLELEDEFPLDFDVAYDSDARQSSGSNSDKSQRHKNRQSMQSIASLASGNNSNDRLSDFDQTPFRGGYLWRKLLSMNSINYRKQQTSILTQIGNR